ncbi:phytanoyl-CoA dioxygenase family protein [Frigidibacter sp. MR17.14]|uniref:phytanoyl-CoA dioxygenase family protein n=1 Tax=Frigidibacter sp. MR17.14 TaxID=3126509 RepID=UPI003FA55082
MARAGSDLRSEYLRDGVTVARAVLDSTEVRTLREEIEKFVAAPHYLWKDQTRSADKSGKFLVGAFMWRWSDVVRNIALESTIPHLASDVLGGERVRLFYDQLFFKRAGTRTPTQWHQDLPFWPFTGDQIPSIWIAVTRVDRNGSAVVYRRASHVMGPMLRPVDAFETSSTKVEATPVDSSVAMDTDDLDLVSFELEPGDVVLHHPLVIHGAGANKSQSDRIGLSIRYLGPSVTWSARQGAMFVPGATGHLRDGDAVALEEVFPLVRST